METVNTVIDPNFSIIMPTGCNAKCSFCFWKPKKASRDWSQKLLQTLAKLPEQFWQISITGAEPTSDFLLLAGTLRKIKRYKHKFPKVVLTTNGYKLAKFLADPKRYELFGQVVNHVNISRHHWKDDKNLLMFNAKPSSIPTQEELGELCSKLNTLGIDVNLNCVLHHFDFAFSPRSIYGCSSETCNQEASSIHNMLGLVKQVNASSICFRVPSKDDSLTSKHHTEKAFIDKGYKEISHSECPVCSSTTYLIDGVRCTWKYSIPEPVDKMQDLIYEAVFHPNGKLTADWKGECELRF